MPTIAQIRSGNIRRKQLLERGKAYSMHDCVRGLKRPDIFDTLEVYTKTLKPGHRLLPKVNFEKKKQKPCNAYKNVDVATARYDEERYKARRQKSLDEFISRFKLTVKNQSDYVQDCLAHIEAPKKPRADNEVHSW